ncbi:hypothetical protein EDD11_003929 [Mortierella claussenii]|nr:hypothetical protein EDD11_003929 [Mortierella claussenii]
MSAANVPDGLKNIAPYLQRAAQLQDRDPVVSYYANYYAAKLAIPKAGQDNSNRTFVVQLLDTLGKQRKQIGDNEAISDDLVGYAHIENFALKIFSKADDEDRAGQGSQKTAKNFVAAANFLELLKVFGDIDSEVEEKIKYSKWRAAEIVKAIRDGRQPAPPPGAEKPKDDIITDPNMAGGLDALEASSGFGANTTTTNTHNSDAVTGSAAFSPAPVAPATPSMTTTPQPGFPTISNFPSPPLGPTGTTDLTYNGSVNKNISTGSNSGWSQPPVSPNLNQHQNQIQFNPPGTSLTYGLPSVASPPTSGYMPAENPNSLTPGLHPKPSTQYGYGSVNSNLYQPPVVPAPASAPAPAQNLYGQPSAGYNSPSAPYQQPVQTPSPQIPYAAVSMVLDPAVNTQVQKHCKWTVSALTYDDIPTAIDNLEKALALLRPFHNKQ